MPIVESRIDEIEPQRPGRVRVHEFFKDHTGQEYINRYDVPDTFDTTQHLADQVVARDAHLIKSEKRTVERRVSEGEDPSGITVDHITADQRLVAIVTAFMLGQAQGIMRTAEWLSASVSDAELDNAIGASRRVLVRDRVTGLLALKTDLNADEALRNRDG